MNILEEVNKLFLDHPDGEQAKGFLDLYHNFAHLLDDIVDGDIGDMEGRAVGKTLYLAQSLYTHPFYTKYMYILYPTIRLVHNTYFDTVQMENSNEEWKKLYVSVLKHCGDEVFLAIIEILGGYDKRMQLGVSVREHTWKKQHELN